jgi:hypothetical protein
VNSNSWEWWTSVCLPIVKKYPWSVKIEMPVIPFLMSHLVLRLVTYSPGCSLRVPHLPLDGPNEFKAILSVHFLFAKSGIPSAV